MYFFFFILISPLYEFRSVKLQIFSYSSITTFVLGAQKNRDGFKGLSCEKYTVRIPLDNACHFINMMQNI